MTRVLIAMLPLTLACGASPGPGPDGIDTDDRALPLAAAEPEAHPAEGVVTMAPSCVEGTEERCDAVDQDCDGLIDEGCGYDPGVLQITLAWNTDADIDLVVIDPTGAQITAASPEAASGGGLDRHASGACGEPTRDRIENARWPETAPSGTYRIALAHVSACDRPETPTTATVSISARARVLGTYNTLVAPGPHTPLATLTLP